MLWRENLVFKKNDQPKIEIQKMNFNSKNSLTILLNTMYLYRAKWFPQSYEVKKLNCYLFKDLWAKNFFGWSCPLKMGHVSLCIIILRNQFQYHLIFNA